MHVSLRGWRMQASLDRESNKKTGPSDEDIIKSFKKYDPPRLSLLA